MLQGIMELSSLVERGVITAMYSAPVHIENIIVDMELEDIEKVETLLTAANWMRAYIDSDGEMPTMKSVHECAEEETSNWHCLVAEIVAIDEYVQHEVLGLEEGDSVEELGRVPQSIAGLAFCTDMIFRYHKTAQEGQKIAERLMDTMLEAQTEDQMVN